MMPRYFTVRKSKVRADDDYWPDPFINIPTVCDHESTDTGLIDVAGDTIMRAANPCGFIWSDE